MMDESENRSGFPDTLPEKNENRDPSFRDLGGLLHRKAREKGIPIEGKFELTPFCNFSCRMCYVHLNAGQMNGRAVLPVEVWKELMRQAWEAGMLSATLTGGECLAYPGFSELYLYLHSLGVEVNVLTNGFLLDEERIRFFREHPPATVQITLYGWNDDVYERVTGQRAYTTVANNIRRAIDSGLPVHVSITPSKYLGEDLLGTVRAAKEMCKSVIISNYFTVPREETGRSGQQDDVETDIYIRALQYYHQLDGQETVPVREEELPPCGGPCREASGCGFLCGGGRSAFAIDWEGTMMPCGNFQLIQGYPLRDGFAAAWAKVNREANLWPRIPECEGCAYESVCNHCASNTLRFAEPGKVPTALCERTREMARRGVLQIPKCE